MKNQDFGSPTLSPVQWRFELADVDCIYLEINYLTSGIFGDVYACQWMLTQHYF